MKKWIAILTLCSFTLYANQTPPANPDTEEPPQTSSPVYATPTKAVREREEPKKEKWRATAAVIGTVAAVTLGLFMSGRDTGKHYHASKKADTNQ